MKFVYVGTPYPGFNNVGDQSQALCIRQWLARYWPDVPVVEFSKKTRLDEIAGALEPNDVIFSHSGGNFCPRGMGLSEKERRAVVRRFRDNKVVSLPQTITIDARFNLPSARETYNGHPDLTVFARDVISYNYALRYLSCRIELCPDFVLGYQWKKPALSPEGILLCLRHDNESTLKEDGRQALKEKVVGLNVGPVVMTDTSSRQAIPREGREGALQSKLLEFARHRVVVTDRLHGVIFSVVSQTPCVVLPTVDHKLTASYWWFKSLPYVRFVNDPSEVNDAITNMLAVTEFPQVDWEGEWFSKVPGIIMGKQQAFSPDEILRSRRTRRKWLSMPVADALVKRLLCAGVLAPSGGNAQCVRYRVLMDPVQIGDICKRKPWFTKEQPPVVILMGYDFGVPGTLLHQRKSKKWLYLAEQDTAAAMENILLAAESVGLAACWVSVHDLIGGVLPIIGDVEWFSALFVGYGRNPWQLDEKHHGLPIARRPLTHYMV